MILCIHIHIYIFMCVYRFLGYIFIFMRRYTHFSMRVKIVLQGRSWTQHNATRKQTSTMALTSRWASRGFFSLVQNSFLQGLVYLLCNMSASSIPSFDEIRKCQRSESASDKNKEICLQKGCKEKYTFQRKRIETTILVKFGFLGCL